MKTFKEIYNETVITFDLANSMEKVDKEIAIDFLMDKQEVENKIVGYIQEIQKENEIRKRLLQIEKELENIRQRKELYECEIVELECLKNIYSTMLRRM